jgi:hypothetical protein
MTLGNFEGLPKPTQHYFRCEENMSAASLFRRDTSVTTSDRAKILAKKSP